MRRSTTLFAAFALAGCIEATDLAPRSGPPVSSGRDNPLERLIPVDDCVDLRARLVERAVSQLEPILKRNQAMAESPCALDDGAGAGAPGDFEDGGDADGPEAQPAPVDANGRAAGFTETNTQVAGVDEADVVETDGEFLYLLDDGGLWVLRVAPVEMAAPLARVAIPGARRMFVDGDRALVYAEDEGLIWPQGKVESVYGPHGAPPAGAGMCPFGHGCDFSGSGHPLRIVTLDLADRSAPRIIRETALSGSYVTARRIGDAVHTVVDFPPPELPGLNFWPAGVPACGAERGSTRAAFDALRAANAELLRERPLEDWLPSVRDVRFEAAGEEVDQGLLESCDSVWYSQLDEARGFTSIISQTMRGDRLIDARTIVGTPGAIYASATDLFIAARQRPVSEDRWWEEMEGVAEATVVHRFALQIDRNPFDDAGRPVVEYGGSTVVKGHVLDQFSIDQRGDDLRLLTSTGYAYETPDDPIMEYEPRYGRAAADDDVAPDDSVAPDPVSSPDVHATFTVLAPGRFGLERRGQVDAVATATEISAVRFLDDVAFLGFRSGGPLQVIDVRDPQKPAVRGRVDVGGELRFLHPVGADLLLAVGVADPSTGEGVALQLIDVSDLDAPALLGAVTEAGGSSEAVASHLAFSYYSAASTLALPMVDCSDDALVGFDGLVVYDVDVEAGAFTERGRVDHQEPEAQVICPEAGRRSLRGVFIDDTVLSVGPIEVLINALADLSPIARVELAR